MAVTGMVLVVAEQRSCRADVPASRPRRRTFALTIFYAVPLAVTWITNPEAFEIVAAWLLVALPSPCCSTR
jgi:hypothetical protein